MIQVVKCPSCAAPLEIDGDNFERCDFCGSRVITSSQNLVSPGSFEFQGLLSQAHKLKEILYLARQGNKIEAIKIYRETFGGGLAEAKEAVENLAAGKPLNFTSFQLFSVNSPLSNSAQPFAEINDLSEIQSELRRGNKINAIKIYREKFNVSLKEAKDAVEALERRKGIVLPSRNSLQLNNQTVVKTAKIIGWTTAIFVLLGILGSLAGIGIAIFGVMNLTKSSLPVPIPASQNPLKANNAFAAEILRFGGEGAGGGFFRDNRLIAVDGMGRVYSANYNGGQLQQFDESGKFLTQWSIGENINLRDLAADKKNRIYVLNSRDLVIYDGSTQQILGKSERPNYKSLALDANGQLYALTEGNALIKLDESGKSANTPVSLSKQLSFESKKLDNLTIDGAGNFYVFDSDQKYVLKYSPDAKFLVRFDNPLNKNKRLNSVNDLSVDNKGRIFASEINEIHVYDNDGRYLDSFETRQSFGIAFDNKNALWTASRPFIVKYQLNQ